MSGKMRRCSGPKARAVTVQVRSSALLAAVTIAAGLSAGATPANAQTFQAVPGGAVGCQDPVIAAAFPDMDRYGVSERTKMQKLEEGKCYPIVPGVSWRLIKATKNYVLMQLDKPVNGGPPIQLYFAPSTLVNDRGQHPS